MKGSIIILMGMLLGVCCMASPTKGIVGGKHIQGSQETAWVNPYVTDGLVAMWDGEWNVGGGVHDANATTWKDLIGNRDATLSGSYSWGSNYWDAQSVSGRGLARWDGTNLPSNQTWEIVIHPSASSGYGRIVAEGMNVPSPIIRTEANLVYMYGYGMDAGHSVIGLNNRDIHLHTIVHPSGGMMDYHIDGNSTWTHSTSSDSLGSAYGYFANRSDYNRGIDAEYYCVRLYSRVLTAAEIAANYAIDKERFGLP